MDLGKYFQLTVTYFLFSPLKYAPGSQGASLFDQLYQVIKFYQGSMLNLKVFTRPKNLRPHEI